MNDTPDKTDELFGRILWFVMMKIKKLLGTIVSSMLKFVFSAIRILEMIFALYNDIKL